MLALIAAILAVILLLPSCGNRTRKRASAETEAAAPAPAGEPAGTDSTTLVRVGQQAPDFTVGMFDGSEVSLASLRGKVVLLNFWATWCPPCREELKRVQRDVIDRFAGRDFVFLPVSRGESRAAVAAFREKTGYGFPMGLDSARTVYDLYATNSIPRNFLIGKDGTIVAESIGYEPREFEELLRTIEKTLE